MNEVLAAALTGLIRASVQSFIDWQHRRARDAEWKPTAQDVEDFIKELQADTPEALKAKVAASLGIPWPPPQ